MGAPESHQAWLRLLDRRLDRGLVALGGPPYGSVVTTDRRFHCSFDGHSWPDLMEAGWEPTETGGVIYLGWEHMCGVLRKDSEYQYRATFDKAVQVAQATTNLLTNPSFETGTSPWASVWGDTLSRVSDDYVYGSYCLEVLEAGNNGWGVQPGFISVTQNLDYTFSAWVKVEKGATGNLPTLSIRDSTWGFVGSASEAVPADGKWHFRSCTGNVGSNTSVRPLVYATNNNGYKFWVDGLQFEQSSYPTPYCDGSLGQGHSWSGTAHASTSSRAAAALSYPSAIIAYPDSYSLEQLTIAGWFIPAWDTTAPTSGYLYLWDIRGADNNNRLLVNWNAAANKWQAYINGANRCVSAAQTFSSWEPQFVAVTIDFDADEYKLYVNDDAVVTNTDALSYPTQG